MSRVDVPTLKCDRCKVTTQDPSEMGRFVTLEHYHMSGKLEWDLCPDCFREYQQFLRGEETADHAVPVL